MELTAVTPTVLLRRGSGGRLEQQIRLKLEVDDAVPDVIVQGTIGRARVETGVGWLAAGPADIAAYLPVAGEADEAVIRVLKGDRLLHERRLPWAPPRRWSVHVVQRSHHDAGYTNLASTVTTEHDGFLESFLEHALATRGFPEDAQARIVIEGSWSIDHFLRHARPDSAELMGGLIRSGHVELTALFGNMTTELCGHETLVRTLYPTAALARDLGVEVISAEHADVPGVAWGLAEILVDAGVKLFCPAFPLYYAWRGASWPSFWDEQAVFGTNGTTGIPGVFWWQTPSGRRLLVWSNNHGCNGGCDARLTGLADELMRCQQQGYPFAIMRCPVTGSSRDNSPYIDYAGTVRQWNATWAWPHLICSTNARFCRDLLPLIPPDLAVHRGGIPGQDYPVGATSTAVATAVNRRNHADVPRAEALGALAARITNGPYRDQMLRRAYQDTIRHDEHTWGHHFPCGPTSRTSELEKALHAHRAATFAHDVQNKAMARIADAVELADDGIHLVVFNPSPFERSDLVSAPLREIDNCGSELVRVPCEDDPDHGLLKPALLGDRWHVSPGPEYVDGAFDLVDAADGTAVPFAIHQLDSPMAPVPHAAQRIGIGDGGPRYGFFERPLGLKRDLQFIARALPALGYRTYRLVPRRRKPAWTSPDLLVTDREIENGHYRIEVSATGRVTRIIDKALGRDLANPAGAHPFGAVVVRRDGAEEVAHCIRPPQAVPGGLRASIRWRSAAPGHPQIEQCLTLTAGLRRLEFAVSLLKDATPRLDVSVAFPFRMPDGRYTLEEPLHVADPEADRLPGAFANRLTVQDWLRLADEHACIVWSSLDAPVVSIARLWPDRVSPAHSCRPNAAIALPPQQPHALRGGDLYSCVCHNNLATNFSVSQDGLMLFRYVMSSGDAALSTDEAGRLAEAATMPFSALFTKHAGDRRLPPTDELLRLDNPAIRLLTLKRAEDGRGHILRLWNRSRARQPVRVALPALTVRRIVCCDVIERDGDEGPAADGAGFMAELDAGALLTVRILE